MAKPQKTAAELKQIIKDRCTAAGMQIDSVTVAENKDYGWVATLIAGIAVVTGYQARFDAIVSEIRAEFDLKK